MKKEEDPVEASYDEKNRDIIGFLNVYRVKMILLLVFVILIYVVIFSLLNNASVSNPESKPYIFIIEIVLWVVLVAIIVMNVRYFNDKDFSFDQMFRNLFSEKVPEIEVNVHRDVPKRDMKEKGSAEVFHLRKNIFNYNEAKEACGLLNSRLATYDEIENAYSDGANWCSYGWSDDQMALFPSQKEYINQLKQFPGHERDCGRIGVNGGFVKNKYAKFGVNCYGKKPYATDKDKEYLTKYKLSGSVPDDLLKKLRKEKEKDFLVTPFNKERWSQTAE